MKNSNKNIQEVGKKSIEKPSFMALLRKRAAFFSFFLPRQCPVCGNMPFDGSENMFCRECLQKLHFIHSPVCPGCGGELTGILEVCPDCLHSKGKRPWEKALSLFVMEGKVKEVIYLFKYRGRTSLARPLGRLCAQLIPVSGMPLDVITYTPLHWLRCLVRGYNQAELLAKEISRCTGYKTEKLLKRKRFTRQQARLGRKERLKNMRNAFLATAPEKIRGKKILLIDDVLTTGATLSSAAEELLKNGAEKVYILVVARRHSWQ